jgi:hypothetical protein
LQEPPLRIRAYGLFPFTRRGYVIVQTCCFTALAVAMAWVLIAPPDTDAYRKLAEKSSAADRLPIEAFAAMLENAPLILAVIAALGAVETLVMMRKFNAAAAGQLAGKAATKPQADEPPANGTPTDSA